MVVATQTGYPALYDTEVLLKDGSRIRLRPIVKEDAEQWLAFVSRLSPETKYLRFHHVPKDFGWEDALRFSTVDYTNSFALVAEVRRYGREEIVALGRYNRLPDKRAAELALVVEDGYQGRGLGTKLMEGLIQAARDNGIRTFEAYVLADNQETMSLLKNYGFHIESELEGGVYHVSFNITPTARATRREEQRELVSTLASLRPLLYPRSVAVIGASRSPGTIGYLLLKCLLQSRFSGVVYPVNPNAEAVMAVKAYPSVLDVPGSVDLATIAVPAPLVAKVADECGRKGVRALVVISDGFKESGEEGAAREDQLREIALGYGMRLVGPNCMGVINTDPSVNLNSTFSQVFPPAGNVAFLTQSGALGLAIVEYAVNLNIGISTFVSVGNRADVSSDDLLQYWEHDPATRLILLYIESFGSPRKFGRIARRVSASKPIVAVKSGSTAAGARAAASHTGVLATPEIAAEALFRQTGIIRVNTVEELFDTAALLSNQPTPAGKRVAIVTNGGGPGILAADACEQQGLYLPEFSPQTSQRLSFSVKRDTNIRNPLDMTASAGREEYEGVLKVLANDSDIDAVIAIFIPPVVVNLAVTEEAIRRVAPVFRRNRKPLLLCFMGQRGLMSMVDAREKAVPSYLFPEDAVSALARAAEYGEWLRRPRGKMPRIVGLKRDKARQIIEPAMKASSRRPLSLPILETSKLLMSYGVRCVDTALARNAEEAVAVAAKIGFPVVLKVASPAILHKTEVGGVALDLRSGEDVALAFDDIRARLRERHLEADMEGVTVQKMITEGIEAIVGMTQDPSFGPLIMFGLGGIYAELLKEVSVRLHPLTDLDARDLIDSIKSAKLFEGVRGFPPSDVEALEDLLLRVSAMVEDIPEIAELDMNPVKVLRRGEGYWVVDARIILK
ncbi:MAG: GNAT family N-acetyltransferase [Chloroflexi bacterium]|nr:GNAT family N-acetyltransferase [Chloroflexota bacterium]